MNKNSFIFVPLKSKDDKKIALIYSATLKLVKEYGLAGITMGMIAKEARLATGTVYLYFTNKEELIVKLFDVCAIEYISEYFKDVDRNADFHYNFKTIWMNIAGYYQQYFEKVIFLEQCFHCPFIPEDIRAINKERFKPWYDLLEKAKREGTIRDIDNIWLISFVRGTIREMVKQSYYCGKKLTPAVLEEMFEMCKKALYS